MCAAAVSGTGALDKPVAQFGLAVAKSPTMARLSIAALFFVLVLRFTLGSPVHPNLTLISPMRVAHVTTTEWSARQFSLDTILGQPAHTWTRRLDDGVTLDGAVFEVAEPATTRHHIYVVHVVPPFED